MRKTVIAKANYLTTTTLIQYFNGTSSVVLQWFTEEILKKY